jgi:lysophospholipase L1-like esterase
LRWPRSTAGRVALFAFFVIASCEVGLRLLADRSSAWNVRLGASKRFDPVTWFRLRSNYRLADEVETNENGYLAPPHLTTARTPGTLRLIYLGDSVSVLPVRANFPAQTNALLEQAGLHVETLNAAVPGFSTENARALFESDLVRYDGDYFFVSIGWNDLGQFGPEGLAYKRQRAGYSLNPIQAALTHVYTLRFLYASEAILRHFQTSFDRPLTPAEAKLYDSYYPEHYERNLRAILEEAKKRYPKVYITNLATITNAHPTESELRRAHYPTGMDKNMRKLDRLVATYNEVVAKVAADEHVEMIDLHHLFDDEQARLDFTDSCHLNPHGAGRVARVLADLVLRDEAARRAASASAAAH